MKKVVHFINKYIFIISAILIAFILVGCVQKFTVIQLADTTFNVTFTAICSIQLFFLFRLLFRGIDYIENRFKYGKYIIPVALFFVMISIMTLLLMVIKSTPEKDSFDDLDAAWYVFKYGVVHADNIHHKPLSVYANNHFLVLFFAQCYKLFGWLRVQNILMGMRIINSLSIITGTVFAWLFTKEEYGINKANKCLLFIVCNPLIYWLMFWIYTLTFSIPLTTFAVWAINRLKNSKKRWEFFVYAVLIGVDVALGYFVRPTAIFPFIAFVIMGLFYALRDKLCKKYILMLLIVIICIVPLGKIKQNACDEYFSELSEGRYPLWYWFSMGSHGEGDISTKELDQEIADSIADYNERSEVLKNRTIQNYKENGLIGTLNLWAKKTCNTWSDGYGEIYERIWNGENDTIVADYMYGEHKYVSAVYIQAFRFVSLLTLLLLCINRIRSNTFSLMESVMLVATLGGIAFFALWEAKYIYSFPFYFMLSPLSVVGCETGNRIKIQKKKINVFKLVALVTLFIASCWSIVSFNANMKKEMDIDYIRIMDGDPGIKKICYSDLEVIEQDFYSKKPFNKIVLTLGTDQIKDSEEIDETSSYTWTLYDENKNELASTVFGRKDISKKKVTWQMQDVDHGGHYIVRIEKNEPEKEGLLFRSRNAYKYDYYSGEMTIDGESKPYDLKMCVSYLTHEEFMGSRERMVFISLYLLMVLCILGDGMKGILQGGVNENL